MALWSVRVMAEQFRYVTYIVGRTMPTLLLFSIFMFLNAEMWKVSAEIPTPFFLGVVGLFVALGAGFVALRLPHDVASLETFDSWAAVRADCTGTPAETSVPGDAEVLTAPVPLRRSERFNIELMLFVGQGVQALLVSLVVTVFYLLLGLVMVGPPTFAQWVGRDPEPIGPTVSLAGGEIVLTRELVVTAAFIGIVGGLQFVVTALSDPVYREEFFGQVRLELRRIFAVRKVYLSRLPAGQD